MSAVRTVAVTAAAVVAVFAIAVVLAVVQHAVAQHDRQRSTARPLTPAQSQAIRQGEAAQSQEARSFRMLEHPAWYGLDPQTAAVCAANPSEVGCPGQPQFP